MANGKLYQVTLFFRHERIKSKWINAKSPAEARLKMTNENLDVKKKLMQQHYWLGIATAKR